jgi:hypothetical protein
MGRHELETGLYDLGDRIWEAIQSDDAIADTLFKLVDMKLALDHVTLDDSRLDADAAKAILMDGLIQSCDGLGDRPGAREDET